MFTGIIQAVAGIKKAERKDGSLFLTVEKPKGWKLKPGDSVATDGVCLTVRDVLASAYTTELMGETLKVSAFGVRVPQKVNLEPSLKFGDTMDGHIVLGHVDAIGKIMKIEKRGRAKLYTVSYPRKFSRLVAAKGAIAVDGVSLTVVDALTGSFSVSLVDYTLKHATLGEKKTGELVNLEFDIIAKYARN